MKNRLKKLFIHILVLATILLPLQSSLVNAISNNDAFFYIENTKINKNEQVVMKINIDKIEYTSFNFKLISNVSISNIDVNNENVENLNQGNNELSFDFNKENSSINTITLNYTIPEELNENNTITFKAVVTSSNEEDEVLELIYEIQIEDDENNNQEEPVEEPPSNQDIPQNNDSENSNNNNNNSNPNIPSGNNKPSNSNNMPSMNTNTNSMPSKTNVVTYRVVTTSAKAVEQVTYKGSNNNYLKSLSVKGYNLNKEFKKESLTYFIEVDENTDSISVNTEKDDSNSKVFINGNTNLKSGLNKVLITVVAENGNTKVYRIYVKKA